MCFVTESRLSVTESGLSVPESESSVPESESESSVHESESESSVTESESESQSSVNESESESQSSVTESELPIEIHHDVSIQQTIDDLPPGLREQPTEDTVWHGQIISSFTFKLFERTFEMLPSVKVIGQIPGKEQYEVEMSELCITFFELKKASMLSRSNWAALSKTGDLNRRIRFA
ncbi:hypothetical protein MKX08_009262 [Trichoderma sp. CBMAI-0020]|nr:hypothetical protein MKX08_009262 [Trichoderma sp. CBMAI-0020]